MSTNVKAFVVAWMNTETKVVEGIEIFSEWPVTQVGGKHFQLLVLEAGGPTYEEASKAAIDCINQNAWLEWAKPLLRRSGEEESTFPVMLLSWDHSYPTRIPWRVVAPFADQAVRNHQQTLEVLAKRGGLDPLELWAVCHRKTWPEATTGPKRVTMRDAIEWLKTVK